MSIKFKVADAEAVTNAMINAIRESGCVGGPARIANLVRDINLRLTNLGVVMVQLDNDAGEPS